MTSLQAVVTARSQTFRVIQELEAAGIHHGQEATAVVQVRVGDALGVTADTAPVYFCNMGTIIPIQITGTPDGQPLPEEVTLAGLSVSRPGYWDVPVRFHLNGAIHLDVIGDVREVTDPYARLREPAGFVLS